MSWGGKREGAGRKVGWRKGYSEQRKPHCVAAFDDEWDLIKRFSQLVKYGDKTQCREHLEQLEQDSTRVE